MLSAFRSLSKSKLGTAIMVAFLVAILASFAVADISNFRSTGFAGSGGTLAKAGGQQVTARELDEVFSRALAQLRRQNPEATGADLRAQFDQIVEEMINERVLASFAEDQRLVLSRRLVDAEIAKLPGTRGLDGKFSEEAYARFLGEQRLTDPLVRRLLAADLTQRLILTPVAANARIPVGVATNYASMLLEQRKGEVALVLTDAFKPGLAPSAGDLQAYYDQNKTRYMVPEQRVLRLATIEADKLPVAAPNDQEIAAYYKANAAKYAGKQTRVISQAVVADKKIADGIAARARSGASFVAAAAPAGLSAEDVSVGPQTREQFTGLAGQAVAAAAFTAPQGGIVGPVKSDLGWHVIKIDSIQGSSGTPLAEARPEIVAALAVDKRKEALADIVTRIEDMIEDGASLPDTAAAVKAAVVETPLITAAGASRSDPAYTLSPDYAAALKTGFDLTSEDDPVVEELPGGKGYVLVGLGRILPAAPAPLAQIRDRVAADWTQKKASDLARASAAGIAAKVARGVPMGKAVAEAGKGAIPPRPIAARRIQIAQANADTAAPIKMLFTLGQGKSRMVADPQGRGYYVVRNVQVIPGNAASQPALISQVQVAFQQSVGQELASEFLAAVRKEVGVERDEQAIAAAKQRLVQSGY